MIYSIFNSVPDRRVTGRCTYPISELLMIALLTYMCNGEDYVDMSEFAAVRAKDFGLLSSCNGRTPSPDTFERLMAAIDPTEIERCLITYGQQFLTSFREKQIAIDGKKQRGASPKSKCTKGDYLLNAFVCENQLLIAQESLTDKENEILAIPRILDKIDIEEAVVSIDAIGTQVDIARQITERGGHYFLAVKDNQGALSEEVENAFRFNQPLDMSEQMEADHGRIETRQCRILPADKMCDKEVARRWSGLKTIVEITSCVDYGDRQTKTTRRYISDENFPKAAYFNMLARGHWGIENNLHWHLDVAFKEDASRARKGFATQNLSLIRKLALQTVKQHSDKRSIRKRIFRASLSQEYLKDMLLTAHF